MNLAPIGACIPVLLLLAGAARAQDTLVEPSTEKRFPSTITLSHGGSAHTLSATGATVRTKFFIKVYALVHYMEGGLTGTVEERLAAVLRDGPAKQLTLDFAREVGSTQIQDAFRDGFAAHATAEELAGVTPHVNAFLGSFDRPFAEDSVLVLRWLPGGVVEAHAYGEALETITDPVFARLLWAIWLGEDSIVDREALVTLPDEE